MWNWLVSMQNFHGSDNFTHLKFWQGVLKPSASDTLGKCSIPKLHPQPQINQSSFLLYLLPLLSFFFFFSTKDWTQGLLVVSYILSPHSNIFEYISEILFSSFIKMPQISQDGFNLSLYKNWNQIYHLYAWVEVNQLTEKCLMPCFLCHIILENLKQQNETWM